MQRCSHKFSLIRYGQSVNHRQSADIYINSYFREHKRNGIAKYLFFLLDVLISFSCIYGKLKGVKNIKVQYTEVYKIFKINRTNKNNIQIMHV